MAQKRKKGFRSFERLKKNTKIQNMTQSRRTFAIFLFCATCFYGIKCWNCKEARLFKNMANYAASIKLRQTSQTKLYPFCAMKVRTVMIYNYLYFR